MRVREPLTPLTSTPSTRADLVSYVFLSFFRSFCLSVCISCQELSVAEVHDAQWEAVANSAGLNMTFTADECADAWDQVWLQPSSYTDRTPQYHSAPFMDHRDHRERYNEADGEGGLQVLPERWSLICQSHSCLTALMLFLPF